MKSRNKSDKKSDNSWNVLLILAVIAVIISAIAMLSVLIPKFSGYQVLQAGGDVNLTVNPVVGIDLVADSDSVLWGSGFVNPTGGGATLDTTLGPTSDPPGSGTFDRSNITNGGDGKTIGGLILENIGNINVSVSFNALRDANLFIGGTGPSFKTKIINAEPDSCPISNQFVFWADWVNVPTAQTLFCDNLYYNVNDTVEIHFRLFLPTDTPPSQKNNTITIIAVQA